MSNAFGVSLGISPRESLRDWMELAERLDERGVGRIWLIDSQLSMKDVYAGLTLAALATRRAELGTGVTNIATRDPTVTAGAIAAVAELSGGRAILGLGSGDSALKGLGLRPTRIAELERALQFLRTFLNGERATWNERTLRLPYAAPGMRLFLAVSRPRMCRLAGRLADGAIIMGPAQPALVAGQVGWVLEGIAQAGRHPLEVELSFIAPTSVYDRKVSGLDDVRSWASAQARLLADVEDLPPVLEDHRQELMRARETYDFSEHLSTRAGHRSSVSDELVAKLAIAGSPDDCRQRLGELMATGIESFIFPLMPPRLRRLDTLLGLLGPEGHQTSRSRMSLPCTPDG